MPSSLKKRLHDGKWQTLKIPSRPLPIYVGKFLDVGMQDSSDKNQIYTVKPSLAIWGLHTTETLTRPFVQAAPGFGIAFSYSVVQY
ncbi:unnamed protein product, partial [Rotaria sp. Silwood1]